MPGTWKPPTAAHQKQALGPFLPSQYPSKPSPDLLASLELALYPDPEDFPPILPPQPGDWLQERDVGDQMFEKYVRSVPRRPTPSAPNIYLQPLEEDPRLTELLPIFLQVMEAFFGLPVRILPSRPMMTSAAQRTIDGVRQCHAGHILTGLKSLLPSDGICILGVTMIDLYPRSSWAFVYGLANTSSGVGVFSFARHDARFPNHEGGMMRELTRDQMQYLIQRSCDTVVHETSHMFGLLHCTFFSCIMQGHNGTESAERFFDLLCPVCLRKLHWNLGFDIVERYRKMARVAPTVQNRQWLEARVAKLVARGVGETALKAPVRTRAPPRARASSVGRQMTSTIDGRKPPVPTTARSSSLRRKNSSMDKRQN